MLKLITECNKIIHFNKENEGNHNIKKIIYKNLPIEEKIEEV